MSVLREVLTVRDVALELRCSVDHVYKVINGKVKNVSRLPAIPMGRGDDDDMILEPKTGTIGRMMEEDIHA